MKFSQMHVENFMSVQDATLDFSNLGLVLIQGNNQDVEIFDSNGSGKSTLFSEAPTWALYGETIRGQKGDTVVNRDAKRNTLVSLTIVDDYGVEYVIIRHRKHAQYKNHVHIFCDGENITPKSDKDADEFIVDLLQMDYTTFTNSIMFGQGVTKMFASSTDAEQKKILEKMLQIDIFKDCQDIAKEQYNDVSSHIEELVRAVKSTTQRMEDEQSRIESLQEEEKSAEAKHNAMIARLQSQIDELNNELTELVDTPLEGYSHLEEELASFKSDIDLLRKNEKNQHALEVELGECDRVIKKNNAKIAKLKVELADLISGKNVPKNCSMCGQSLPLEDTTHLQNHVKDNIKELEDAVAEEEEQKKGFVQLLEKVTKKCDSLKDSQKKADSLIERIAKIKATHSVHDKNIKSLKAQITRAEDNLQSAKENSSSKSYENLINKATEKVEEYKKEIKAIKDKEEELSYTRDDLHFWVNAFGNQGIKSLLLDSVTPFLNTRANYYLSKLADSTIAVTFNTQVKLKSGEMRDKFSVEVTNESGDDSYKGNSGGEKRRVDVAVNMALQDLINSRTHKKIDLIVYDEVYEGLDAAGCEQVVELLKEKATQFGSVVVITHNDNLKQLFDNSITVRKEHGMTKVSVS